ncbi:MAG: hypothetical protein WC759_02730, partial [Candidatus Micrarchaeia archaeon]
MVGNVVVGQPNALRTQIRNIMPHHKPAAPLVEGRATGIGSGASGLQKTISLAPRQGESPEFDKAYANYSANYERTHGLAMLNQEGAPPMMTREEFAAKQLVKKAEAHLTVDPELLKQARELIKGFKQRKNA